MNELKVKDNSAQKYLVYLHYRTDTGDVVYVGESKRKTRSRPYTYSCKKSKCDEWLKLEKKGLLSSRIVKENLNRQESYALEKKLIKKYGRKDLSRGTLLNRNAGGSGCKDVNYSDEFRKQVSQRFKGRPKSKESIVKMILSISGEKNWNFGKKLPNSVKKKLSEKLRRGQNPEAKKVINVFSDHIYNCGRDVAELIDHTYSTVKSWLNGSNRNPSNFIYLRDYVNLQRQGYTSKDIKELRLIEQREIVKGFKGENNPNYGKSPSAETRKKASEAHKGYVHSDSAKQKMSERRKLSLNGRAKKVINFKTLEVYGCGKEVAQFLGRKCSTVRCWLNGANPNRSEFMYLEDYNRFIEQNTIISRSFFKFQ